MQRELLSEFFGLENRFFLTGGAALAGFHLGHRTTQDLDLFATADILDDGERALRETTPRFRMGSRPANSATSSRT